MTIRSARPGSSESSSASNGADDGGQELPMPSHFQFTRWPLLQKSDRSSTGKGSALWVLGSCADWLERCCSLGSRPATRRTQGESAPETLRDRAIRTRASTTRPSRARLRGERAARSRLALWNVVAGGGAGDAGENIGTTLVLVDVGGPAFTSKVKDRDRAGGPRRDRGIPGHEDRWCRSRPSSRRARVDRAVPRLRDRLREAEALRDARMTGRDRGRESVDRRSRSAAASSHPTRALWPPSTARATPVMKRASSEARKRAA